MLFSIVAACFVATALAHDGHDHGTQDMDRIELTIYYESLCPDSVKFFKDQLSPTYNSLKDHLTLDFVPFGKAKQTINNGSYSFECDHGTTECYGNMVQACVVENYKSDDVNKVVNCMMTEVNKDTVTNSTYPTVMCFQKFNVPRTTFDSCLNNQDMALMALSKMGNKTEKLSPPLKSVPSVAVNKHFDYSESEKAVKDLKPFICKKFKDSKKNVKECSGSGIITSSALLLVLSSIFRGFISS